MLARTRELIETERRVQDRIRAGALVDDVDAVLRSTFSYQTKAAGHD